MRLMMVALALAATPAMAQDSFKTKVPRAHADAYMKMCEGAGGTNATCFCHMGKLAATREGDAVLDVIGYSASRGDAKPGPADRAAALAIANRHGMKNSEMAALGKRTNAILAAAFKQCE